MTVHHSPTAFTPCRRAPARGSGRGKTDDVVANGSEVTQRGGGGTGASGSQGQSGCSARVRFTLTELLVVMVVIALLAGLTIPVIGKAKGKAHAMHCQSNLRQLGVALRLYLNDSADVMPIVAAMPSLKLNDRPPLNEVLFSYVDGVEKVFRCSADSGDPVFFEREGSSYQFHAPLGGRRVTDAWLSKRFGDQNTPVMYDYEPFHGRAGTTGAANYLFADGHVGVIAE